MIGDAQARALDHRYVIGAVADRQRQRAVDAAGDRRFQFRPLARRIDDRRGHRAQQRAVGDFQHIGDRRVEADLFGDGAGEAGEATRHQQGPRAARLHRAHQRPGPAHDDDSLRPAEVDRGILQPLEQRHAFMQRAGEVQFAAHRPLGDFRDLRLDPRIVGQLVDALDGDHGRIHVGDQQFLLARLCRLHDDVDARAHTRQSRTRGRRIGPEEQVGRLVRIQPAAVAGRAARIAQPVGRFGNIPLPHRATSH